MKHHKLTLIVGCLLFVATGRAANEDFIIVPGLNAGPVRAMTSEAELRKLLGSSRIRSGMIDIGEGYVCKGVTLFPKDPSRLAEIVWLDAQRRARPFFLRVRGLHKSAWRTSEGITLGTSLKELEKLNGKPFKLFGCCFDGAGIIFSWENGALAKFQSADEHGHWLRLSLDLGDGANLSRSDLDRFAGHDLSSDDPLLQSINPKVDDLEYTFEQSVSCKSEYRG